MKRFIFATLIFSALLNTAIAQNKKKINLDISSLAYTGIILEAISSTDLIIIDEYDQDLPQVTIGASFDGYDCRMSILLQSESSYSQMSRSSTTRKEKRCKRKVKKFMSKQIRNLVII